MTKFILVGASNVDLVMLLTRDWLVTGTSLSGTGSGDEEWLLMPAIVELCVCTLFASSGYFHASMGVVFSNTIP